MMKTQVEERFTVFYEQWVCQLEENLQQLIKVSKNPPNQQEIEALVSKLTTQHKEYYTAKWAAAHEDILAFYSPVWLSPLESAYLWLTGWKPSTAFCLIDKLRLQTRPHAAAGASLTEMSEEQMKKIEQLRIKIRHEELKVEREMERQQMSLADRRMVELARLVSRVNGGAGAGAVAVPLAGGDASRRVDGLVEVAVKSLLAGLERLMKAADCVRLKTLKGVLDVLSPLQCVDFLAANSMLVIQLGKWGKKRESNP